MGKPILLDLFCGAGGAAKGYADAGFEVIGVDIEHHEDFPYEFHVGEALATLDQVIAAGGMFAGKRVGAVHASPPCQAYSTMTPDKSKHPELVEPVRERLLALGVPYAIENVPAAPLVDPTKLCGSMFPNDGLRVRRHRLFETNFTVHELFCNHKRQGRWWACMGRIGIRVSSFVRTVSVVELRRLPWRMRVMRWGLIGWVGVI